MTLKLNGSSSGHVNLDAKATAANNTITLPDTASGELIAKDSSGIIDLRGDNTSVTGGTTAALTATNTLRFTDTDTTAATDQPIGSIQFQSTDSSGAGLAATIAGCQSSTAYSQLDFHTGKATESSGNNQVQRRVRIDQDNVTLYTGNLKFNTAGKGIDFSATADGTTMGSELFDDYEEGTFQPSWSSTGVGLTFTYHSDYRHGYYTKIGNLVTFNLYISSTAAPSGDATNPLYISGLPYSSANSTANSAALTIGFYYNITAGTDEVFPLAYINKNTSQITLTWSRRNSDTNQQMISSDLTDYTWLTVAGSYRV